MPSERLIKLNELFRVEVGKILKTEIDVGDDTLITVLRADVSPTLEHATIRISVFPRTKEETALKEINRRIYFIQQILNKRLSMRPVPKIRFDVDRTEEQASKIEKILEKMLK